MKRLWLILFALAVSVSSANALCPAGMYYTTNGDNCIQVSPGNPLPVTGGGGGGGLSVADGTNWVAGTSAFTPTGGVFNDSATPLTSGQEGTVRLTNDRQLKVLDSAVLAAVNSPIPAQTNRITNIGTVDGGVNLTLTNCSGTITTGGTAQNAFAAQTTLHGFTIANIDSTTGSGEPLWISFTTTAAASTAGSFPLPAPTATTFAGFGSFTTPFGFGSGSALSVIGVTTGHKFSCTWW